MLGFLNVFKPSGPSSTQVGARVRRMFERRLNEKIAVGHLGTLDPTAAGVLPLALGKATRLIPLIEDRRKAYAFTLVLGRLPEGDELALATAFIRNQSGSSAGGWKAGQGPSSEPQLTSWEQLSQVLLLTNEFMFVD